MAHTVTQLNDLPFPTVLASMSEPFDTARETPASVNESDAMLAGLDGDPVYLIIDLSHVKSTLGNIMEGLAGALLPHDDLNTDQVFAARTRLIMIGSSGLIKVAVRAAGQDQYGRHRMEFFETLDEALEHIRQAAGVTG